jgi:hypothetical protein
MVNVNIRTPAVGRDIQLSFNIQCCLKLTVTDTVISSDATERQQIQYKWCDHPKLISERNDTKVMNAYCEVQTIK